MPGFRRTQSLAGAAMGTLPAWLVGVLVMLGFHAGMAGPSMNTAGVALGMLVLLLAGPGLSRQLRAHPGRLGLIVVALLLLPFISEPMSGVHRWVGVGPVRLHVSSILAPIAFLALVSLLRQRHTVEAIALLTAVVLVHIGHPDAGQATAIAAAGVVATLRKRPSSPAMLALPIVAVAGALVAWSRPDPLEPVALVEDMPARAFELGLLPGIAGVVGLVALPAAAALPLRRPSPDRTDAAFALATYFAATIAVTFIGHFPTPVLGQGASPIIGAVVGLGLLWGVPPEAQAGPAEAAS